MTTKEKAKVIDVVKQMIIDGHISQEVAEKYFPELKECEDEQHRKWILEYLYDGLRKSDEQFKDQFKSAIAWLKEQGQVKESSIPQHENKTCEENSNSLTSEEDERIRKEIKQLIQCMHDADPRKGRWLAWLEKQGKKMSDPRYSIFDKLIEADDIYQMSMNDAMTEEAKNKAIEALSNLEVSKVIGFEKQGEQKPVISNDALREGIAHFGITQYQIDNWLKKYVDVEKQGEQKPKDRYTFNSIPRLLEMIEPTDKAKAYCQKLIDSLLQEGYATDAKIVGECLKQMNGEKVAMATMDEQKPTNNTKLSDEETNRFAKGVLTSCALSFINYLDAHKYEGKMCVSNVECEDIENAFHNAMWDRLHRYYCKYIEKQCEKSSNILHDVNEEPEEQREIFCEWGSNDATWHDVVFYHADTKTFWMGEQRIESVVKWAYIDEMLEKQGSPVLSNSSNIGKGEQKPTDSYCREDCKGYQETGKCFADGDCKTKY